MLLQHVVTRAKPIRKGTHLPGSLSHRVDSCQGVSQLAWSRSDCVAVRDRVLEQMRRVSQDEGLENLLREFTRFRARLGFSPARAEAAWGFQHPREGLLVFRLYGTEDPVEARGLRGTRESLDLRGLLGAEDFDTFVYRASAPA
jgi:hypothetical protein